MSHDQGSEQHSNGAQLASFVGGQAAQMAAGYATNDSHAVRQLAQLRNNLGRTLADDLATWEVIGGLPEALKGRGDHPSRFEQAAFTALCLFGSHQQGRRDQAMHQMGKEHHLGRALRRLAGNEPEPDKAVTRRFVSLGAARDFDSASYALRGLVSQLRQARIPLDYGRLASDLASLQSRDTADRVRQRWGRQYFTFTAPDTTSNDSNQTHA